MPRIAIDCRFAGEHAGLGTFTREIVLALLSRNEPWEYVLLVQSVGQDWLGPARSKAEVVQLACPHYSVAEQFALPKLLKSLNADVLFSPQFNAPLYCPVPFVVTVHDLILHHFPNNASFLRRMGYFLLMSHAMKDSAGVITVSHATKSDIVRAYGEHLADKIIVAHPGVSKTFAPADDEAQQQVRRRHGIDGRFLVYVGNAKQHKNVQRLIDAFTEAQLPEHQLLLVTGGREAASLRLAPRVRLLPGISHHDLPALYTAADGFLSASMAEGFGLPMLEAMACGCPVLATDIPAVREVCGEYAVLVRPASDTLAGDIRKLLQLDRAVVAARGIRHAEGFAWMATASIVAAEIGSAIQR